MSEAAHNRPYARGPVIAVAGAAIVLVGLLIVLCWPTLRVEWAVWTACVSAEGAPVFEGLTPDDAPRLTPYLRSSNTARRDAVASLFTHWWEQGELAREAKLELTRRLAPVKVHVRRVALSDQPIPVRIACGSWLDRSEHRYGFSVSQDGAETPLQTERTGHDALVACVAAPSSGHELVLRLARRWAPSAKAEMISIALPAVRVRLTRELPPEELRPVRDPEVGRQLHAFLKPRIDRAERTPTGVSIDLALVSTHNLPAAVAAVLAAEVDGRRYALTDVHLPSGDPVARYWKGLVLEGCRSTGWRRVTLVLEPKFDVAYKHPATHTWWAEPLRLPSVDVQVR